MAGGPSTVELVAATAGAGALAFLAGGYKTATGLADEMAAVAAAGVDAFGVNLFVPGEPTADRAGLAAYLAQLEPDAAALGAALGEASWDDDDYAAKVDVVLAAAPAAVSFTFGVPDADVVRSLQAAGSAVLLTVTTPEEALRALRVGPDALCLQGAEAGAHRGSLVNDDRPDEDRPIRALLAAVRRRTLVPLVAAGGVGGPGDVADLLARGADLVQAGTAFLRCPESGAAGGAQGRPRRPRLRRDRGHAGVQRPPGPRARQRHGGGPPGRAGRLPRDQQRHPAAPCGGRPGRRPPAHEPVRGDGVPSGRGPAGGRGRRAAGVRIAPVSSGRRTKTIEFTPPDVAGVADSLRALRDAGSGWVNLMPGIDEDAGDVHPRAGLFAFFGNQAAPVTMTTVMPPKQDRRDSEGLTVGVMHPTGGKAVARLAEAGVTVPEGWVVRQDHARRGLLVQTPVDVSEGDVIAWSVRAGTALCRAEMTGRWRAVVYLP